MLDKYFDIRKTEEGKILFWWRAPRDGAPMMVDEERPPLIKEGRTKIRPVVVGRVQVFDLSREEDREKYEEILDRSRNGWYKINHVERVFQPEKKNWLILVEWSEYYVRPEE